MPFTFTAAMVTFTAMKVTIDPSWAGGSRLRHNFRKWTPMGYGNKLPRPWGG